MVTGLYPSPEGLEDEQNRDDAPEIVETSETPGRSWNGEITKDKDIEGDFQDPRPMCANSGEGKPLPHEGIDCQTVIYSFANHFEN